MTANVKALAEYPDRAIHLYNAQGLGAVIYPFLQQNVLNYRDLMLAKFKKDLADSMTWQLLPLGATAPEVRKLAARGALRGYGQGVYTHRGVPTTSFTEPTIAVALAGEGAFLHRESVLDVLGLGQFNPPKVRVGTRRRVRRTLPEWMELESRHDVPDEDLTRYEGTPATTVRRALEDMRDRMPPDRWEALVVHALRRELIGEQDIGVRRGFFGGC